MTSFRRLAVLPLLGLFAALVVPVLAAAPAQAAARVTITNEFGNSSIDGTYSTKLTIAGTGFQSIQGGHGGVYVWFGTVSRGWQPSRGGLSGVDYKYVPDTESADNQGFQQYVAFPDSDTAASAASTMSRNGTWRVNLTVPGPTFKAVGRNGSVTTVDCRKVTCGVITAGAHGVKNARNETFTPVRVAELYTANPGTTTTESSTPDEAPDATVPDPTAPGETAPVVVGEPTLEVDRTAAAAGRVLAFTASGLPVGQQVSLVFDDGRAGAGPFLVGNDGALAGVITIPAATPAGTYELRVFGIKDPPSVKFAVRAADEITAAPTTVSSETSGDTDAEVWGKVFAGVAAALFLVALARVLLMAVRRKRAA